MKLLSVAAWNLKIAKAQTNHPDHEKLCQEDDRIIISNWVLFRLTGFNDCQAGPSTLWTEGTKCHIII